ncbi:hypothetical protein [Pseudonocardia sp. TRM90224]|uniref:hypothetical protein n=1 Tax=Pseudonocardia sp. TRM90224 TaxID=2812678 RepID=UPI001E2AF616|nr:hypothetical protein [Pseudonocardia sp. TRM90224]
MPLAGSESPRMAWTGKSTSPIAGEFAANQAANLIHEDTQRARAARVVAGHSIDAADCSETLAMLGLTIPSARAASVEPLPGASSQRA